ncbi:MAG TPA: hypothetical protein VF902_01285 [Coriobacteriia bacterium]
MREPSRLAIGSAIAVAVSALVFAGCASRPEVTFVADGAARSYAQVEAAARSVDLAPVAGITVEDAPDVRTDVLVYLRGRGAEGDRAASLLTKGFPTRTAAVPVHVEVARIDGVRSLIAVEAFGDASGDLRHRRLWVFDYATGELLHSAAFR